MNLVWTLCAAGAALPLAGGAPLEQHPNYARVQGLLGLTSETWVWSEGGCVLGAALVQRRRWPLMGAFAVLARGPLWAPDVPDAMRARAVAALVRALRQAYRGVQATPDAVAGQDPLEGRGLLEMVSAGTLARLDLTPQVKDLRAGLAQKWRNRLRHAEGSGLSVTLSELPAPDHWLWRGDAAQRKARGYAALPQIFAQTWGAALPDDAMMVAAEDPSTGARAAMVFLLHPPWATYHIGWTGAEARAQSAHTLCMWQGICALKARGITALELDSLDTLGAPGLARFKLGTGARPVPMGATRMSAVGTAPIAALVRVLSRQSRQSAAEALHGT